MVTAGVEVAAGVVTAGVEVAAGVVTAGVEVAAGVVTAGAEVAAGVVTAGVEVAAGVEAGGVVGLVVITPAHLVSLPMAAAALFPATLPDTIIFLDFDHLLSKQLLSRWSTLQ